MIETKIRSKRNYKKELRNKRLKEIGLSLLLVTIFLLSSTI